MIIFFLVLNFASMIAASPCATSDDCGSTTPYCVNSQCVGYCQQDSDCQKQWTDSACVLNLCSCYNEDQCAGTLICSRTEPTKGRCVTCETLEYRGCLHKDYPACQAVSEVVSFNSVPTTVTTYSCGGATSPDDCTRSALMVARDRLKYVADTQRCVAVKLSTNCGSSSTCNSPSAAVCESGVCSPPKSTSHCAKFGSLKKTAWIDNSCVECATNSDCVDPLPICDVTTYSCVKCFSDSECPL